MQNTKETTSYSPSQLVSVMTITDKALFLFLQEKVNKKVPSIMNAISKRSREMSTEEKDKCKGYLSIGAFTSLGVDEQLACYSIIIEAEHCRELKRRIRMNQKYKGDEPIFHNEDLQNKIVHDGDLVDYSSLKRIDGKNIIKIGDKYGRIDPRIPMDFFHWLEDCFYDKERSVHVNPYDIYNEIPSQILLECIIQPPKHEWWNTLKIYNGESCGYSSILLGNDISDEQDYHDYNVLGIRKLQVSATRQNAIARGTGNMQIMIEELTKIYECRDSTKSYLIGRMIHLDTDAKTGTPFNNAILNHIDIAENLYIGDTAYNRYNQDLATEHRIEDATYRTHLLRVDNIGFDNIFKFAYAFFKSKKLVDEWKAAEFSE